jgi:hypothetical protein
MAKKTLTKEETENVKEYLQTVFMFDDIKFDEKSLISIYESTHFNLWHLRKLLKEMFRPLIELFESLATLIANKFKK